jgi:hypothetical protein
VECVVDLLAFVVFGLSAADSYQVALQRGPSMPARHLGSELLDLVLAMALACSTIASVKAFV